ncbi:unnamed protein product, partial [Staurois parvus]
SFVPIVGSPWLILVCCDTSRSSFLFLLLDLDAESPIVSTFCLDFTAGRTGPKADASFEGYAFLRTRQDAASPPIIPPGGSAAGAVTQGIHWHQYRRHIVCGAAARDFNPAQHAAAGETDADATSRKQVS